MSFLVLTLGPGMVYDKDVAKRGPSPYEDETGDRSEYRLPLIPVTRGEYEAVMAASKLVDNTRSYADWARAVLKRAAARAGVDVPREKKKQKKEHG